MVRRITFGLLLVGFIVLIYLGYRNWSARRSMLSGDVTSGPGEALPADSSPLPPAPVPQKKSYSAPAPGPAPMPDEFAAPATDSQLPQAPNGLRFASTERFEVYRQGNLTYRIDTDTGRSCVLYATREEWRKPEVYRHGCGSSAAQ